MKKILLMGLYVCAPIILLSNIIGRGWIVYHERAFEGRVLDAQTKEPIEGAVVVATYYVRDYTPWASGKSDVDDREVLTNKNGDFFIPFKIYYYLYPAAIGEETTFTIDKQGYENLGEGQHFRGSLSISAISPSTIDYLELDTRTVNGQVIEVGTKKTKTYPEGLIYAGKGCGDRFDTFKQSMPLAWISYIFFSLEGAQKKIRNLEIPLDCPEQGEPVPHVDYETYNFRNEVDENIMKSFVIVELSKIKKLE